MSAYEGPIFDADGQLYEAHDALARHVPEAVQPRCVQWKELMGADDVTHGSDWPHVEGMEHPRDILGELDRIAAANRRLVLHHNATALNELRPA